MGEAWAVCRFKGGLGKKEGVVFLRGGGGVIPQCTLCDCETFDYLHSLEQVGVIFRTPSNNLLPLDLLAHCRNGTSSSLFYRYYFYRWSSELAQLVPRPYFWVRSTNYSDRLHASSVPIPKCYKDVCGNSFFRCTAGLWNSLHIKLFSLIYDLNGFIKSRHLLHEGSF